MQSTTTRLTGVVLLLPVFIACALTLFAWPNANLSPRSLPLGLVGPAPARAQIAKQLQAHADGGFDIHVYRDEAGARAAIGERDIYGAFIVSPAGTTLLIASAASPVVAQLLTQAVTAAMPPAGSHTGAAQTAAKVVDVVPAAAGDPRGSVLSSSVLPLILSGVITALLIVLLSPPGGAQAIALIIASCLAGLVADGIVQGWLGVIRGSWPANACVLSLIILAIATGIAGLYALFGRAGLAIGALLMVFVGNPLSGITSAPELLPTPTGTIGQLLPAGAGGTALRSTAFFSGHGVGTPLAVLGAWSLLGLCAIAIATRRSRSAAAAPEESGAIGAA